MNGLDADLTEEEAKAFVMFLYSEAERHRQDIDFIHKCIMKAQKRFNLSMQDLADAHKKSRQFTEF
jgi:hypothetical protein